MTDAMRTVLLVSRLALYLFSVAAGGQVIAADETARLNAWLDARYDEELQLSPIQLTMLGRKTRYDEIDDYSVAGEQARYRLLQQSVVQLQKLFDYEKLTEEGKTSYDYWVYRVQIIGRSLPFLP